MKRYPSVLVFACCLIFAAAGTADAQDAAGKAAVKPADAAAAKSADSAAAKAAAVKSTKPAAAASTVVTTASGLKYEVLNEGSGASPSASDKVTVHYRGTLTDGTEFDSSYKRGEPATFPLNRVIKGWTEGLQLMKEGAKYRFTIPPQLGYGERGAGAMIPPNATLVFDVELLKVN